MSFDGRSIFPLTAAANPSAEHYAVIVHEDWRTPLLLPELFPNVEVVHQILDPAGAPYAQVYRRPANTLPARPPHIARQVTLGDGIALLGYDVQPDPLRRGASLYLQLHWGVTAPPQADWTVFTHVVDAAGKVVAGFDSRPGRGTLPTQRWQTGWRVLDEYEIALPADLPPGEYILRCGLYQLDGEFDGARLPEVAEGITLGSVTIGE